MNGWKVEVAVAGGGIKAFAILVRGLAEMFNAVVPLLLDALGAEMYV